MITLKTEIGDFEVKTDSLVDMCIKSNTVSSKSEFKRLLREGAIYFNGKRLNDDSIIWGEREVTVGDFSASTNLPCITML